MEIKLNDVLFECDYVYRDVIAIGKRYESLSGFADDFGRMKQTETMTIDEGEVVDVVFTDCQIQSDMTIEYFFKRR